MLILYNYKLHTAGDAVSSWFEQTDMARMDKKLFFVKLD